MRTLSGPVVKAHSVQKDKAEISIDVRCLYHISAPTYTRWIRAHRRVLLLLQGLRDAVQAARSRSLSVVFWLYLGRRQVHGPCSDQAFVAVWKQSLRHRQHSLVAPE